MNKNERPYVICLMMTSVDGKILGEKWGDSPYVKMLIGKFEEMHERLGIGAWIVGRTTMEKDFTHFAKPMLKESHKKVDREDFVANSDAISFAVVIDGSAKLGWHEPEMLGDHVISILTEAVPDAYLNHLRDIGVSYLFAGKSDIDLELALRKLKQLFGIKNLMLEGGGHINGSFLNAGLIDELCQLLLPIADGTVETATLFDINKEIKKPGATLLKLKSVEQIEYDALLLTYLVQND